MGRSPHSYDLGRVPSLPRLQFAGIHRSLLAVRRDRPPPRQPCTPKSLDRECAGTGSGSFGEFLGNGLRGYAWRSSFFERVGAEASG